jgi:DNA-binding LytR/AlgR family response regulator
LLEDNIRNIPFLSLVARCRNAMEAIEVMLREPVDLVFSDIQMPGLNGLQLIQSLQARPMFILITAHEKFALEGYNLDVVDYLLKPVAFDRFVQACNKALKRHNGLQGGNAGAGKTEAKEYIFLPVDYKMVKVSLKEPKMIEGVKDYIRIHFSIDKPALLVRMSMKGMEEMLEGSGFLRIHKSYIISIHHLTAIRKNAVFIGNAELPVGEQYREAIARLAGGEY